MKILIIGQDNFSIPDMDGHLIDFHIPANEIKETIDYLLKSNAEVIIIQSEQTATETELYGGLELLIWLRIKGIKTHIVLVSLFSLEELIKNCKNALILGSKGTSFCQMPFLPSSALLIELSKEQSEVKNFRMYLSSLFDKIKFRHREANWWGVKSLWDVHNVIYNLRDAYPNSIEAYEKTLNNYIAKELFSYDEEALKKGLIDYLFQNRNNRIREIDIQAIALSKDRATSRNLISSFSTGRFKNDNAVKLHETIIQNIDVQLAQLNVEKITTENANTDNKEKLETWIEEIKAANPRLLYIDDNAKNGWEEILQKMLPGILIDSLVPVPKFKDNISGLYADIVKPKLSQNEYTLIILDLRLFDETDINIKPEKLSGSHLLKEIKRDYSQIPVMIITASNKRFSYSTLINLGADAYWTKEGIDEYKTAIDSVTNYELLMSFTKKLHSKEFEYLSRLINIQGACNAECWWCEHEWINGDRTIVDFNLIKNILRQITDLYKAYLHRFFIESTSTEDEAVFFLTSLINKFGLLVEAVHELRSKDDFEKASPLISYKRIDTLGKKIRDIRNDSSHLHSLDSSKRNYFEVIDLLEKYLNKSNRYTELMISMPVINKSFLGKPVLINSKYNIFFPDKPEEISKIISQNQIENKVTIKVNEENEGIVIIKDVLLRVGTKATLMPKDGVQIGDYFIMAGDIYKINIPIKNRIVNSPDEVIIAKYNNGSACWEIDI